MIDARAYCPKGPKFCPACKRTFERDEVICPDDRTMLLSPQSSNFSLGSADSWFEHSPFFGSSHCQKCLGHFMPSRYTSCPEDASPLVVCSAREKFDGPVLNSRYKLEAFVTTTDSYDVYSAVDQDEEKIVFVKVLSIGIAADEKSVNRFTKLALAAIGLKHPNIVPVHDLGYIASGRIYLITNALSGHSLKREINQQPIALERALEYFVTVSDGLAFAHDAGVVHSNLLSSSIFLDEESGGNVVPKLMDFGIAKRMFQQIEWDKVSTETHTTSVYGDPIGFCPEFSAGGRPTPQSDIYQLGCCLYEALFGEPVFEKNNVMSTICAHLYEPPERLDSVGPLPEQLNKTILRCLEKKAEDRFQSAKDLQSELQACLSALAS